MAYTKQGPFTNDTSPPLNATRVTNIDQGVYDLDQATFKAREVASLAALRSLSGSDLSGIVRVRGYAADADGGEGWFRWVSSASLVFTADSSTDTLSLNNPWDNQEQVILYGSTLPGGLASGTRYFVKNQSSGGFKLGSERTNIATINITSNGSGAMTVGLADNDGTRILPTSAPETGYWQRTGTNGELHALWFGVAGIQLFGAPPDRTTRMQKLRDAVPVRGCRVVFPPHRYTVSSRINWPVGTALIGGGIKATFESLEGAKGTSILNYTTGLTVFSCGQYHESVYHDGFRMQDFNFVDVTAGGTSTLFELRLTNFYNFYRCSFIGATAGKGLVLNSEHLRAGQAAVGAPVGTMSGDCSWGDLQDIFVRNCQKGIYVPYSAGFDLWRLTSDSTVDADYWGLYVEGGPQIKVYGGKFDGGKGIFMRATDGKVIGTTFEQTTPCIEFHGNAANTDGRDNKAFGVSITATPSTYQGITIDSACQDTQVIGTTALGGISAANKVIDSGVNTLRIDKDVGFSTSRGGIKLAQRTVTSAGATLIDDDSTVLMNMADANSRFANLPTAVGRAGRRFTVKKIDATAATGTILPNGSETIDSAASVVLPFKHSFATVESDGANWLIVSTNVTGASGILLPRCRVTLTTDYSVATSGLDTVVPWDSETIDTHNWHSTVSNPGRVIPGVAGSYLVTIGTGWAANATGVRKACLLVSGARLLNDSQPQSPTLDDNAVVVTTYQVELTSANYLELQVTQTSGGALNLNTNSFMYVSRHG